MTVYMRAQGCTAKIYDTAHQFGLSYCQKTMYRMTDQIGDSATHKADKERQKYLSFFGYDNLARENSKQEERLDSKTTFDVGTAATLYIVKDPDTPKPNLAAYVRQVAQGMNNPITSNDILALEQNAAPDLRARAVHRVLQFLIEAPDFDFATYPARDDPIFTGPAPIAMFEVRTQSNEYP
jgi:hypothetical protein